jgi:peroxiredoxin Q/BCP
VAKKATKAVSKAATKAKEAITGKETAPAAKGKAKKTNGSAAVTPPAAVDAEVDDPTAEPVKSTSSDAPVDAPATAKGSSKPTVGEVIALEDFGGEIETNEGEKTTLKALVDASKAGVVLFTYPKASTPGCKITAQPLPVMQCVFPSALRLLCHHRDTLRQLTYI